jgi:hypothetical protein
MASQPLGQAYSAKISELGGDDWFFDQVAGGSTVEAIAEQVGCSRTWLYTWIKKGQGRRERFKEAQRDAALLVFEDAGKIPDQLQQMDTAELTSARVQVGKLKYDHQIARAKMLDPDTFGEKPPNINVLNIGELHLDALRKLGSMSQLPKPEPLTLEGHTEPDEAA